jgi:hypothetical protein
MKSRLTVLFTFFVLFALPVAAQPLPKPLTAKVLTVAVEKGQSAETLAKKYFNQSKRLNVKNFADSIRAMNKSFRTSDSVRIVIDFDSVPKPVRLDVPKNYHAVGVYFTPYNVASSGFEGTLDKLKASGVNTIIFDLKTSMGELVYPTDLPLATEIGSNKHLKLPLAKVINAIHERGMQAVARLTCFRDEILTKHRPDLCPQSISSGGVWLENGKRIWADASNPVVQEYIVGIAKEIGTLGIDEIQLDYVRFPAEGNVLDAKFYFQKTAKPVVMASDAKHHLSLNERSDNYDVKKYQVIRGFLEKMKTTLEPMGVRLSADIFGIMAFNMSVDYAATGQKLEEIMMPLDAINPMVYPSHFDFGFHGNERPGLLPYKMVKDGAGKVGEVIAGKKMTGKVSLRPYLQAFAYRAQNFGVGYIHEQMRACDSIASQGYIFWNAAGNYDLTMTALKTYKTNRQLPTLKRPLPPMSFYDSLKKKTKAIPADSTKK